MPSITTSILSKSVGLLMNKVRDKTIDKLKDGDIVAVKIREIIVKELNDVKSKLDCLSPKDLHSSYSFLVEGVNLLKACLDKSEEKQKAVLNETSGDGGETSTKPSDAEPAILTEALTLSQAIERVKINSDRELESAKEQLKEARKAATKAYRIETLRIEDRIFAAKLRIVSELLECLESPDTAILNCLPFLEGLHSLPAIREIFSVYINGGYKSMVGKAEDVENVKAVMVINYVLFQFVSQFSSEYCSAITWPTIELADRSFHPIFHWNEVSTRRSWDEECRQPSNVVTLDKRIHRFVSAVNSHGQFIFSACGGNINVASRTGEVKMVELNHPEDSKLIERDIRGLAVDSNNNIYVVMRFNSWTKIGFVLSHELYVFDENYDAKRNCPLQFLDTNFWCYEDMAINKNTVIIMSIDSYVYMNVCDNAGQLKHKFKMNICLRGNLTISDKNEILFASFCGTIVRRYTEKGDLESTIEVPEGHKICYLGFHHAICKIMVLTLIEKSHSHFLLCYSKTGELDSSTFLWKSDEKESPVIRSHPNGPAAFIWYRSIAFI